MIHNVIQSGFVSALYGGCRFAECGYCTNCKENGCYVFVDHISLRLKLLPKGLALNLHIKSLLFNCDKRRRNVRYRWLFRLVL